MILVGAVPEVVCTMPSAEQQMWGQHDCTSSWDGYHEAREEIKFLGAVSCSLELWATGPSHHMEMQSPWEWISLGAWRVAFSPSLSYAKSDVCYPCVCGNMRDAGPETSSFPLPFKRYQYHPAAQDVGLQV